MRLLMSLALFIGSAAIAVAQETPNIVLVIADDMGLDASACYDVGDQQAPMPVLESLCANGMVFENAYAAPVCTPTRATIMSGKYGFRTGVGTVGDGLSEEETSLFDILDTEAYQSTVIGKWHIAPSNQDFDHPTNLGVEDYFGMFSGSVSDYFEWDAVENGEEVMVSGYTTTVLTDRAIDWVAEQQEPWFLWLAYNAPHTPVHLPPADLHSFDDLPEYDAAVVDDPVPYYNAALEALDSELGRLLNSLSQAVFENTVIIFIGDNGTPRSVADDLYGDRGAKGGIFEGGTHIPLIVAGSGIVTGRSDALVNTTDLHATIASLAGISTDQASDSYDISTILQTEDAEGDRSYAYVEHFLPEDGSATSGDSYGAAIRGQRYKLVLLDDESEQLFDLRADPFEVTDLLDDGISPEETAILERLSEALDLLWSSETTFEAFE